NAFIPANLHLFVYFFTFLCQKVYYLYVTHFIISLMLGFLPYIKIPTLYILAANIEITIKVPYNSISEIIISQKGIPNGILTIITIGAVKGIRDVQNASGPSGLFTL